MVNYWRGWPIKCEYVNDIVWGQKVAITYMSNLLKTQKNKFKKPLAIIFDVDETLVFGDPESDVGVKEMELGEHNGQCVFCLPPNPPIVKIANWAKQNGIHIFILTARPFASETATITNMKMFNIPYSKLIMNNNNEDPEFKIKIRRTILSKFDVLLTVGDQPCDILLPGQSGILKLPSAEHKTTYFAPGIF